MCGICGGMKVPKEFIKNLMLESEDRGKDATGIAYFNQDKVKVFKQAIPSSEFVETPEFNSFLEGENTGLFIGHTRQKTQGDASNNNNNHPLYDEGVAVIHNGVISNDKELITRFKLKTKAEVDSEVILRMYLLFKKKLKPEEAFNKVMEKLRSGAVAIIDRDLPNKIMVGATSSSLIFAYIPKTDSIVFASSESIIKDSLVTKTIVKNWFVLATTAELYYTQDPKVDRTFTIDENGITEFKVTTEPYYYNDDKEDYDDYGGYGSWHKNQVAETDKETKLLTGDTNETETSLERDEKLDKAEAEADDKVDQQIQDWTDELEYEWSQVSPEIRRQLNIDLNWDCREQKKADPNFQYPNKTEREEILKEMFYDQYLS